MHEDVKNYNESQSMEDKKICDLLEKIIETNLQRSENKVWHAHPVWFVNGNPIVGYSKQKAGIRLMFWSGKDFDEEKLTVVGKKFKDASIFYTDVGEVDESDLKRWLKKSEKIQWDYKNIVKRKGKLVRIK